MLFSRGSIFARDLRDRRKCHIPVIRVNDNAVEAREVIYLKRQLLMAFVQHFLYTIVHGAAPRKTEAKLSTVFSAKGPEHADW
jgi:hypothetical protein